MQGKILDTKYVSAELIDGIIEVQYKDDVYITLTEAQEVVKERIAFFGDKEYPYLFKASRLKGIDRAARKFFFNEGLVNVNAIALVPGNKVGQMITTVLVSFERPPIPCKVFKSHGEARIWLKEFIEE
jgi:hypothetical protein